MTMKEKKRSIWAIIIFALVRVELYLANGSACGITFYQPQEPDLSELFERRKIICHDKRC